MQRRASGELAGRAASAASTGDLRLRKSIGRLTQASIQLLNRVVQMRPNSKMPQATASEHHPSDYP